GREIRDLQGEFHKLSRAVQPQIMHALALALRAVKDVLPALRPLVKAAANALDGFLGNIDDWLKSPSGKKFIHWMSTEGPHAIAEFGKALWIGAQAIGRFADFMFNTGETMRRTWFRYMPAISNVLDVLRETFIRVGHSIEAAWNATVAAVRGAWSGIYSALVAPVARAYSAIVGFVNAIRSALAG